MRWTLAVSMDSKVFVAIVDSEGIGQQRVPNVARMVKEAKVRMARHRARKANQAKGKLTRDGKEKGKGKGDKWQARKTFEGHCNHCWKWGHMEKDFTKAKTKGKGKSAGSLDESETSVPENTSVGGFGLCSFGNSQCDVCNLMKTGAIVAK